MSEGGIDIQSNYNFSEYKLLDITTVLNIHHDLMNNYDQNLALRDINLLESALSSVKNLIIYEKEITIHDIAAGYCYFICKNHPFMDGNKRTAFLSMVYYLDKHNLGLCASISNNVIENKVRNVASNELSYEELGEWLKTNTEKL